MKNLVIMAGGKSNRMGTDKVFLEVEGETFLEHLYRRGNEFFDNIYISTNTVEHAHRMMELPGLKAIDKTHYITDEYVDCGPMGGIISVFEKTDLERFAVIPTDVPLADMRVLALLFEHNMGVTCILKGPDDFLEPLIGVYDRSCLAAFRDSLARQSYSIRKALVNCPFKALSFQNLIELNPELAEMNFSQCFTNINYPDDYSLFRNSSKS